MNNNQYDVESKWNAFVKKLNERAPERYENRKTFDGDPRGNYDVPGDFNKLAPGEAPTDYYSQEEVVGPNNPQHGINDMGELEFVGGQTDHFEVERALRDAMEALGEADPAEVYEKLMALHDMIETMPAP